MKNKKKSDWSYLQFGITIDNSKEKNHNAEAEWSEQQKQTNDWERMFEEIHTETQYPWTYEMSFWFTCIPSLLMLSPWILPGKYLCYVYKRKWNRKLYECSICAKFCGFNKTHVPPYMGPHSDENPFKCQHCSKQFKSKIGFNIHMKMYSKSLPFKCQVCHHGIQNQFQTQAHPEAYQQMRLWMLLMQTFLSLASA